MKKTTEQIQRLMNEGKFEEAKTVLIKYVKRPWLGLATTKELKNELQARGPESPDNYKTHQKI